MIVFGLILRIRADGGSRRSGNGSSLEHRACAVQAGLRTGKGHPRVERTRARHRPSVAKEGRPHFLACARRAKSPRPCSNQELRRAILSAAPWPAVLLRLATLAFVERQAKEHPRATEGPEGLMMKGLIMKGVRKITSTQHVRVASLASYPGKPTEGIQPRRGCEP